MREPIRVFVVDDHEMVRRGLIAMMEPEPDIIVVGEAGTAEATLGRVPAVAPDVVLLDVRLPDGNGIEVCRELLAEEPGLAVLIVTSYSQDEAELAAAMAGAAGFFLKNIASDQLLAAIRRAADGQVMIDAGELIRRVQQPAPDPAWQSLSPRERRVLLLIGEGLTNRQIGEQMYLRQATNTGPSTQSWKRGPGPSRSCWRSASFGRPEVRSVPEPNVKPGRLDP